LTISSLLLAPACELHNGTYPTDTGARSLVVHGMLASGESRQEIILEYGRNIGDGYFKGLTPATGARIEVVGEAIHDFHEDPSRPGIYQAAFAPQPGLRFALRIRGPAGEVVTAETLVPDPPRFIAPAVDTAIAVGDTVSLRWLSAPAAAAYIFGDYRPGKGGDLGSLLSPAILDDTSYTIQGIFGGTSYQYRVAAVDSNYIWYAQRAPGSARERDPVSSTVSGAFGLFGSYALSDTRTISVR
jgi:hypothetical protein